MRPALVILLLSAGYLGAQQAGAEGIVIDRSTGQPLRGVHVRMVTGDFGSNNGINAVYGATSDAAGRFSAQNMKPGLYLVLAERAGFLQVAASSTSPLAFGMLTLKAGQYVTDYKLEMTPRALIVGRVVDEYGDPVDNVQVQLEPRPPAVRQETLFGNSNATTDDRGEFRLIAAPGKYYVQAMARGGRGNPGEIRTDGTSAAPFVTTFYPNAASNAAASVVQVAAGQDLAGIEIHMNRATGATPWRGFTISGIVTGAPDTHGAQVMLRHGDTAEQLNDGRSTFAGPDGKFTFTGMLPGYYSVVAVYSPGKITLQSRRATFHLVSDETNLQLILAPGEDLTGSLELVGDAPSGASEKHTVRLESADSFNPQGQAGMAAAEVGKDGSFRITNVPPGKFKAVVEPMPENGYVKAVTLDNKPAADEVLDLSQGAGGSRVKITISRAGGQISGRVLGKDGDPAIGMVMVLLETDPKLVDENNATRVSDGTYTLKRIRPGKYHLYALDILELVAVINGGNEDDIMKQFFEAADEIEIKEGDRIFKDITAFTKLPEKK